MRAPTSWRIICARSASAPRWWWGCASSARWRCWSGCSASSRPAAPICRSTPTTRGAAGLHAGGCARAGAGHAPAALRDAAARTRRATSCCLDADWPQHRRAPRHRARKPRSARTTPPMSSTPQAPPEPQRASRSTMQHRRQLHRMRTFAALSASTSLQIACTQLRCLGLRATVGCDFSWRCVGGTLVMSRRERSSSTIARELATRTIARCQLPSACCLSCWRSERSDARRSSRLTHASGRRRGAERRACARWRLQRAASARIINHLRPDRDDDAAVDL